ncbi:MAG: gliding motility lipoprotein GldH [Cyclobacteriaceae bacterium]
MKGDFIKSKLFFLLVSCLLASCQGNRLYEEYIGFPSLSWAVTDTLAFPLPSFEPMHPISVIGIRYNQEYEFHNLYVRCFMKDSLGNLEQDTLVNIHLFDSKTGKPLGKGFGSRLTLYDTLPLSDLSPKSTVEFIQYMRMDTLKGIEAVGLKVMGPKVN